MWILDDTGALNKHWLYDQVEIIEGEFPQLELEELMELVQNEIEKITLEKYVALADEDRFDHLVDEILKNKGWM